MTLTHRSIPGVPSPARANCAARLEPLGFPSSANYKTNNSTCECPRNAQPSIKSEPSGSCLGNVAGLGKIRSVEQRKPRADDRPMQLARDQLSNSKALKSKEIPISFV